jgi:hypothetical protein
VAPACDKATCDTDGDAIPDVDEEGLGTDPDLIDTDGDGLEDGLELLDCCTDPTSAKDATCSKFLIQGVYPGLGPPATAVLIRATAALESPKASVGGKPLDNLFADSTIVLGQIAKDAALGEVVLTSGSSRAVHDKLFAVLVEQPQLVTELSQQAQGVAPPMYALVDQAFAGSYQFLLGASTAAGSAGAVKGSLPVLLMADRSKPVPLTAKALVKGGGEPLGLAAGSKGLVVLTDLGGKARLTLYLPGATAVLPSARVVTPISGIDKLLANPVGIAAEASGDVFQLLTRDYLLRFRLDSSGAMVAARALQLKALLGHNLANQQLSPCSGGTVYLPQGASSADQGITYLACNQPTLCPAGKNCPEQGRLLRIPLATCLKLGNASSGTAPTDPSKSCGTAHPLLALGQLRGAPVVDADRGRLYVLSTKGVAVTSAAKPAAALKLHVVFDWQRKQYAHHLMALSGKHLFVVDGPVVRRLEPLRSTAAERRGRAFAAGSISEEATMLMPSPDGKVLSVGRQLYGSLSSVMGVCLAGPCK